MNLSERTPALPIEMLQILELLPPGKHLPWWELHRRHEDVYGIDTRPAAFRQEIATLRSMGFLRPYGQYEFELADSAALRH
jgi:hypothetical protein